MPAVEDSSADPALSSKYKCRAQVFDYLERETGIEPATFSLGIVLSLGALWGGKGDSLNWGKGDREKGTA